MSQKQLLAEQPLNELVRKFKDADYLLPEPPRKGQLTRFCILHCPYVEKGKKKFACPRLTCPKSQRRKYQAFLIKSGNFKRATNSVSQYRETALIPLQKELKALQVKRDALIREIKRDIEQVLKRRIKLDIITLQRIKEHFLSAAHLSPNIVRHIAQIDRQIEKYQNMKVAVSQREVDAITKNEPLIREYNKQIQGLNMKLYYVKGDIARLAGIAGRDKNIGDILELIGQRGRPIGDAFTGSKHQKKLEKVVNGNND